MRDIKKQFHTIEFYSSRIPPIILGAGKLKEVTPWLIRQKSKKVLVVAGNSFINKQTKIKELEEYLKNANCNFKIVTCTKEPDAEFIDKKVFSYYKKNFDSVIAIGGGSVIDAGKAISAMLPHGNSIMDHLEDIGRGIPHSGYKLPFLAVPTTSGTGGEATKNAVITKIGPNGYKKSIRNKNFIPDAIIIDGYLLTTAPQNVTVSCGFDSLTQLIESFISSKASPISDAFALSGLKYFMPNFLNACTNKYDDIQTRHALAYASVCSGISLANADLGIVHGIAVPLGGFFPIPHGMACGTLLSAALRVNVKALKKRDSSNRALKKLAEVGNILFNQKESNNNDAVEKLIVTLEDWTTNLKMPKLSKFGIRKENIDKIIDNSKNRNNPILLNKNEIREIIEKRI